MAQVKKKFQVIFDRQKQKAKAKKDLRAQGFKGLRKIRPWVEDKIKAARKLSEHPAARTARRFGGPAGVASIIIFSLISVFSPKSEFQKVKERLAKNPNDFEVHLILAENFLENNQYEEAEKMLLLAQQIEAQRFKGSKVQSRNVLGEEAEVKLQALWKRKHYSDPKDIKRLIAAWEKIIGEEPDYRDGYLELTRLYYKIYEDEKAKENLQRAVELDPNFEPAKELGKILGN